MATVYYYAVARWHGPDGEREKGAWRWDFLATWKSDKVAAALRLAARAYLWQSMPFAVFELANGEVTPLFCSDPGRRPGYSEAVAAVTSDEAVLQFKEDFAAELTDHVRRQVDDDMMKAAAALGTVARAKGVIP